jgi:ATP-dependent Zn protease
MSTPTLVKMCPDDQSSSLSIEYSLFDENTNASTGSISSIDFDSDVSYYNKYLHHQDFNHLSAPINDFSIPLHNSVQNINNDDSPSFQMKSKKSLFFLSILYILLLFVISSFIVNKFFFFFILSRSFLIFSFVYFKFFNNLIYIYID